jgi:N-acetylglucosamine-6-phosphate deacetylase
MRTSIRNGIIITPQEVLREQALIINDNTIERIGADSTSPDTTVIDAKGCYVVPGFIDVHVHGADGYDTMDATPKAIQTMGAFYAKHGVTSYYPTTMTMPAPNIQAALENVEHCPQPTNGAQHLGVHVEGPYLNLKYKGAQPPEYFRPPVPAEYGQWLETGVCKLITVAPEIEGSLEMIQELTAQGVEFAIGHSAASYEEAVKGFDVGVRQVTHVFNGMVGLHHREPGALAAILTDDRVNAQLIADGIHVHPGMIRMLIRAKGADHVMLITDAIEATGLSDGDYDLGGQKVTVKEGIARIANGALAGSTLTMDKAIRNMVSFTDLPLQKIIAMASTVPARAMRLANKGKLEAGCDADIVLLNRELEVMATMVGGSIVYQAEGFAG